MAKLEWEKRRRYEMVPRGLMAVPPAPPPIHCSFCGKDKDQVEHIIAGPQVFICDECVELCHDLIQNIRDERRRQLHPEDRSPGDKDTLR